MATISSGATISPQEKGVFLGFLNQGGNVLDFTVDSFDAFTLKHVGFALTKKYKKSKGKSLSSFVDEASDDQVIKIFAELIEYHDLINPPSDPFDPFGCGAVEKKKDPEYEACKEIVDRWRTTNPMIAQATEDIKEIFSSEYINQQVAIMMESQSTHPTDAIGKAKELVESCCKTILGKLGKEVDNNWNFNQLVNKTMTELQLTPKTMPAEQQDLVPIKAILGNLLAIANNIATLRNGYGSGHGKDASFEGLEERHAKLAIGACTTLVHFLWDSYEQMMAQ